MLFKQKILIHDYTLLLQTSQIRPQKRLRHISILMLSIYSSFRHRIKTYTFRYAGRNLAGNATLLNDETGEEERERGERSTKPEANITNILEHLAIPQGESESVAELQEQGFAISQIIQPPLRIMKRKKV